MKKMHNFYKMTCISMAAIAMLGCTTLTPEPDNVSAKNAIQWRQDFDYSIEGHIIARPTQAFTDGKNTYLQFRDRQPIGKITDSNGKALTVRDGNSYKEVVGIHPVLLVNLANQYTAKVTYNAFTAQTVAVAIAPTTAPDVSPAAVSLASTTKSTPVAKLPVIQVQDSELTTKKLLVPESASVTAIPQPQVARHAQTASAVPVMTAPAIAMPSQLKSVEVIAVEDKPKSKLANAPTAASAASVIASVATNTGVSSTVPALPATPQAVQSALLPAPIPAPTFSVANETTTLGVLNKWAINLGYQLIVNGQTTGKQFPAVHPVVYVDLPLLPGHKTISARSVPEGISDLIKVYRDAKVNLNGIEFSAVAIDSKKTIEVKAIQMPVRAVATPATATKAPVPAPVAQAVSAAVTAAPILSQTSPSVAKPIPIQKVAEPTATAPLMQTNTSTKAAPVAVAVPVDLYVVTAKDQGLITLLTRWAQQAGFTTTINGETVAYATFPVMKTPAASNAIEYPLASGLKTFKSQPSLFEAVKTVFQSYTGSEQLPKDFILNIDPAQKVLSIQSPTKS